MGSQSGGSKQAGSAPLNTSSSSQTDGQSLLQALMSEQSTQGQLANDSNKSKQQTPTVQSKTAPLSITTGLTDSSLLEKILNSY